MTLGTHVTVYDAAGEILRCVAVFDPRDASIQAKEGEFWLLGKSDPKRDRVNAGVIVRKTAAEIEVIEFAEALPSAKREIVLLVRQKRLEFITDLPAQVEVYKKKEAEARAYLVDPAPDLADYPRLSDEIGITAPTAQDLATLWVAMADAWDAADRTVERARMEAKAALAGATTTAEVDAAMTALRVALDAVQPPDL
ncbi:hypothetical protein [Roseovarius nitratireducens]|uniref:hypothetical protein n=1 Tax=Roseovarius nitratireducens TaxID=2044597 RepID=UPI000CE1AF08|nr:hypothetical protein [Roseovarius nitratireducens]